MMNKQFCKIEIDEMKPDLVVRSVTFIKALSRVTFLD
jgi:hypothetical protein